VANRHLVSRRAVVMGALSAGLAGLLASCQAAPPTSTPEPAKPAAPASAAPTSAQTAGATQPAAAGASAAPAAAPARPTGPITLTLHVNSAIRDQGMTKPAEGRYSNYHERMLYEEHAPTYSQKNPNVKVNVDWWVDTARPRSWPPRRPASSATSSTACACRST